MKERERAGSRAGCALFLVAYYIYGLSHSAQICGGSTFLAEIGTIPIPPVKIRKGRRLSGNISTILIGSEAPTE